MKKFLLGTVGVVALGLAAPAVAADLPARTYTKAPAYVAAVYDWSGFYIGANAGWGNSRDSRFDETFGLDLGAHDADGAVAGGQIGYRWQTGTWVFGLEAQGDWADLSGNHLNPLVFDNRLSSKTDAFGLFTGQIGYAWNNALLYVKGGAAVTDRKYDFTVDSTGAPISSTGYKTRWSGTVGVGLEYGFAPNWSFGVEYDHIFESRYTVAFTTPGGLPAADSFRTGGDTDLVTARINYRWGGPLIPRF
ncbi:outer membrane protein [Rhodopseudomonas palustris]|uniref:Putative outer membrane protein n=1 Tax=Rhodopseudomonas palustris (strain BisB18) TaxID=316056 RepID=Q213Y2_RHOPB